MCLNINVTAEPSFGTVDIAADKREVTVAFSKALSKSVSLILRHCETAKVIEGGEYIASQEGNILRLNPGVLSVRVKLG